MTQVSDIPDERGDAEADPAALDREPVDTTDHGAEVPPADAGEDGLKPDGHFGTLKQQALNRWSVRDRET